MHTESTEVKTIDLALVGGLGLGAKLREGRIMNFSPTGVTLHEGLTFEQWSELMRFFRGIKALYHLALADIVAYGKAKYGEEQVANVLAQLEFDFVDVTKAEAIAVIAPEMRHPSLTSEHYWVVGRMEKLDEAGRAKWLRVAVSEGLTPLDLQRSIEAGVVVKVNQTLAAQGRGTGIAMVEGFRQLFDVWRRKVDRTEPILKWDDERKRKFLEEVEPVVQLAEQVKASLGGAR